MDLAKKVVAGEAVPTRVVTRRDTFDQQQAKAGPARTASTDRRSDAPVEAVGQRAPPTVPSDGSELSATRNRDERTPRPRRNDAAAAPPVADPVVQMRGISASAFPGSRRSTGSTSGCFPGEVHALMGENGAGKSTLIKALTGVYDIDAGEHHGRRASRAGSPARPQAQDAGISTVYQEVNLCTNLTVAENILLGREPRRFGRIDYRAMNRRAAELLGELGPRHRPAVPARCAPDRRPAAGRDRPRDRRRRPGADPRRADVQPGRRRGRRAVPGDPRGCATQGIAILFVSHFLDQVYEISDRMTVLRNGRLVGEYLDRRTDRSSSWSPRCSAGSSSLLEELERQPPAAAATSTAHAGASSALGVGRNGAIAADRPRHPPAARWSAWPACSARAAPSWPGCSSAPTAPTSGTSPSTASRRDCAPRAPRSPNDSRFSSEDRKAEGLIGDLTVRGQHGAGAAGPRGFARPLSQRTPGRAGRSATWTALDIRPATRTSLMRNLSRRQPAEGAAGPLADHRAASCSSSTSPPAASTSAPRPRSRSWSPISPHDGMAVLFISAELDEVLRHQRPGRGAARPAQGRRARPTTARVDDELIEHHRRRSEAPMPP